MYENGLVQGKPIVNGHQTKWNKFMLRARQLAGGKAAVINVTLVIDRDGNLECWTEPKCSRLENAPKSLGALIKMLLDE